MMRKAKTAWALALMISMLVMILLAGCGQKGSGQTEQESATSGAAQTQAGETTENAQKEQVVVSFYGQAGIHADDDGKIQTDEVSAEITRLTGISMKGYNVSNSANYNTEINVWIASGDYPADIIYIPAGQESVLMPKIISAKGAVPMDEYLEGNGKHLLSEIPERVDYCRHAWSTDMDGINDGKLYFLGLVGDRIYSPAAPGCAFNIRWDLYEQLGCPKVEKAEDLIPVFKSMMELEPTNVEGKKTYGFGGFLAEGGWGHWTIYNPFSFPYGLWYQNYLKVYDHVNDDFVNYVTDPDSAYWKEGISFWNKGYRAGVVDPESFTMTYQDWAAKMDANRLFLGFADWNVAKANKVFTDAGTPEKGFALLAPFKGETMAYDVYMGGLRPMFISKNAKRPDKAVELLDFLSSYECAMLTYNGIKGKHWDIVNGEPEIKKEVFESLNADPEYGRQTGIQKYFNMTGRGGNVIHPEYGTVLNLFYKPEVIYNNLSEVAKKSCDYYGIKLPTEKYAFKDPSESYFKMEYLPSISMDQVEEINVTLNNVNSYIEANIARAIQAQSDSDFEKVKAEIISELKKMGADRVTQIYRDRLQQAKNLK